jgi:hypothetical protein
MAIAPVITTAPSVSTSATRETRDAARRFVTRRQRKPDGLPVYSMLWSLQRYRIPDIGSASASIPGLRHPTNLRLNIYIAKHG